MDLYIAKREILENFPKIILGKSLRLLVCVAPVNIVLTVAQITFQKPFRGGGGTVCCHFLGHILDCLLPASRSGKNAVVTFLKMSLLDQHKCRLVHM